MGKMSRRKMLKLVGLSIPVISAFTFIGCEKSINSLITPVSPDISNEDAKNLVKKFVESKLSGNSQLAARCLRKGGPVGNGWDFAAVVNGYKIIKIVNNEKGVFAYVQYEYLGKVSRNDFHTYNPKKGDKNIICIYRIENNTIITKDSPLLQKEVIINSFNNYINRCNNRLNSITDNKIKDNTLSSIQNINYILSKIQ